MTAIAVIVLSSRIHSGQPATGQGYENGCCYGLCPWRGASMSGETGCLRGSLYGTLVIGLLNHGLNIFNINSFWHLLAKGLIILSARYLDDWKNVG